MRRFKNGTVKFDSHDMLPITQGPVEGPLTEGQVTFLRAILGLPLSEEER